MFRYMYIHPLDPRCHLANAENVAIYTTHVSRVVEAKEDNMQLKTLTSGAKYSVLRYTKASTVQIYKAVSCMRG